MSREAGGQTRVRSALPPVPEPGLQQIQDFLQSYIVHPGSDDEALDSAVHAGRLRPDQPRRLVRETPGLNAIDHLDIYRETYLLRMDEALESDYPAVKKYVGEAAWWDLIDRYVARWPSQSYTLNRLGDHFPEFLAEQTGLRRGAFLRDLARLERSVNEVFDAAETPSLTAAEVAAIPPEAWADARLRPVAALQIGGYAYPVGDFLAFVQEGGPAPSTRKRDTFLAVHRQDYVMERLPLTRAQYGLLCDLVDGQPLGAAMERLSRRHPRTSDAQVQAWFQEWIGLGFWSRVEV